MTLSGGIELEFKLVQTSLSEQLIWFIIVADKLLHRH